MTMPFTVHVHPNEDAIRDPDNDNVDVEVRLEDGRRFIATFFTPANVESILRRYASSGECGSGLFFWAANPIFVRMLSPETIQETVNVLLATGEFFNAFAEIPPHSLDARRPNGR